MRGGFGIHILKDAEMIEPQVRNAVLALRRKGYSTYESGFYDENFQVISCQDKPFTNYVFPEAFVASLKSKGVEITIIDDEMIQLKFDRFMDLAEIKQIWDDIAEILPPLGRPAEPSQTGFARNFRDSQQAV